MMQGSQLPVNTSTAADRLLDIARRMLEDLHADDRAIRAVSLDASLDHDLGLDSLARVELLARIEHELGASLPETTLQTANTLGDIAAALGAPAHLPSSRPREQRRTTTGTIPPRGIATLDSVLRWHVEHDEQFVQLEILNDRGSETFTYRELWDNAQRIAAGLQQEGVTKGDRIALMLPTCREYFFAFLGSVLAGGVPVPLYPPTRPNQIEEHVRRHRGILDNAAPALLISTPELHRLAAILQLHTSSVRHIATPDELLACNAAPIPVTLERDDPLFLQYTSGSTGQPKGVVLTHANVLSNIEALGSVLEVSNGDVFVSWLPLYHDMGLIGAWLGPLYFGVALKVMSPLAFLARPIRWLEAIDRYRGTLSAAPNFAYEMCITRIPDELIANLDLSSWRAALNGAEAVSADTLKRFRRRFAACGLRPTALMPVYGLAENSVGLTIPPLGREPLIDSIDRDTFARTGRAVPVPEDDPRALRFVACGRPIPGHEVRIVDEAGHELPERHEGRLEFRGPSATTGYFRNPGATSTLIHDGWLDSGDRAYIVNGEIYPTGRIKDIVIRAGRHLHPEEIEAIVGAIPGVRKGCVAVFGSRDASTGTERVVVLAETNAHDAEQRAALKQQILHTIVRELGEPVDEIVLCEPHTVLKTSSGKIRRSATRELYEAGLHRVPRPRAPWLQALTLALGAAPQALRRAVRRVAGFLYAIYFWAMLALLGVVAFLLVLLPFTLRARWAIVHHFARAFFTITGVRVHTSGAMPSAAETPCIFVANHASYLDAILLAATLPFPCSFVAKAELGSVPVLSLFMRRLDTLFVERYATGASVEDAERVVQAVAAGRSLMFFPEGTFTRAPGLLPFRLGAFVAAATARAPLIPIAIRGARSLLRDTEWIPKRVPIDIAIGTELHAAERTPFLTAVALRDAARKWISERCGEAPRR